MPKKLRKMKRRLAARIARYDETVAKSSADSYRRPGSQNAKKTAPSGRRRR